MREVLVLEFVWKGSYFGNKFEKLCYSDKKLEYMQWTHFVPTPLCRHHQNASDPLITPPSDFILYTPPSLSVSKPFKKSEIKKFT